MKIEVMQHSIIPNQEVIELSDEHGFIATIIPKKNEIAIVSKYITGVEKDMEHPPKITVQLTRR